MLLVRSSDQPARAAASGSIDWRAVVPAGSKAAASAARTASTTRLIASGPNNQAINGMAATAVPDSESETSETRRRPKKSTAVPATSVESTSGTVMAAATIDASRALSSCCNASHGNATIEMPVPAVAISVANRIRNAGPRLLLLIDIAAESNAKAVNQAT